MFVIEGNYRLPGQLDNWQVFYGTQAAAPRVFKTREAARKWLKVYGRVDSRIREIKFASDENN